MLAKIVYKLIKLYVSVYVWECVRVVLCVCMSCEQFWPFGICHSAINCSPLRGGVWPICVSLTLHSQARPNQTEAQLGVRQWTENRGQRTGVVRVRAAIAHAKSRSWPKWGLSFDFGATPDTNVSAERVGEFGKLLKRGRRR